MDNIFFSYFTDSIWDTDDPIISNRNLKIINDDVDYLYTIDEIEQIPSSIRKTIISITNILDKSLLCRIYIYDEDQSKANINRLLTKAKAELRRAIKTAVIVLDVWDSGEEECPSVDDLEITVDLNEFRYPISKNQIPNSQLTVFQQEPFLMHVLFSHCGGEQGRAHEVVLLHLANYYLRQDNKTELTTVDDLSCDILMQADRFFTNHRVRLLDVFPDILNELYISIESVQYQITIQNTCMTVGDVI